MNKRSARGAAMVEFAIVVPLLVILVFGIVEIGRAIYQHTTLGKGTDAAARYLTRVWNGLNDDCTSNAEWTAAESAARNLAVYGNETGSGNMLLPGMQVANVDISVRTDTVVGGDTACVVRVHNHVTFDGVFGEHIVPFLDLGPIELSATREARYLGE